MCTFSLLWAYGAELLQNADTYISYTSDYVVTSQHVPVLQQSPKDAVKYVEAGLSYHCSCLYGHLACGHKLPSFQRLFLHQRASLGTRSSPLAAVLANPFTVAPLLIAVLLVVGHVLLPR